MESKISYFLYKTFLSFLVIGLFFLAVTDGQAKESQEQSQGQVYLSSSYISDYIIRGLLSPERINSVTGKFGKKVQHSSTFLWRGPVSFSFQGLGIKDAGAGAFYAINAPLASAGLSVEHRPANANIQFIIQNNIIEDTIATNAENLNKFSLEQWLISEIKKHIYQAKNKKCFWISYPNSDGIRFKAIILLNSEMGHIQTFKCTEKAILEILGFYNFYKDNKYHRILDLVAIQVLYDLFKSKSPFDDISPNTIREKIDQIVTDGQINAYLSPNYISKYVIAGLRSPEFVNQSTGKVGKKINHFSTFLWRHSISFHFGGSDVNDAAAGVFYAMHNLIAVAGISTKQVSTNPNLRIVIQKDLTDETLATNAENLKKFGISTGVRRRLLQDIAKYPQQKCYWRYYPGRWGVLRKAFIVVDAKIGHVGAFKCAEQAIPQILGFYNFHKGNKYHRILDLIAIQIFYDLFKSQSPFDDISPDAVREKIRKLGGLK